MFNNSLQYYDFFGKHNVDREIIYHVVYIRKYNIIRRAKNFLIKRE